MALGLSGGERIGRSSDIDEGVGIAQTWVARLLD